MNDIREHLLCNVTDTLMKNGLGPVIKKSNKVMSFDVRETLMTGIYDARAAMLFDFIGQTMSDNIDNE